MGKYYRIFSNDAGQIETVKRGWSWPAFLFCGLWAFYKRLWWRGIGLMFVVVIPETIGKQSDRLLEAGNVDAALLWLAVSLSIVVAIMVYCGRKGNDWVAQRLERKGYVETVSESTLKL